MHDLRFVTRLLTEQRPVRDTGQSLPAVSLSLAGRSSRTAPADPLADRCRAVKPGADDQARHEEANPVLAGRSP